MAVTGAHPRVHPGAEVDVTPIAGEPFEPSWEADPVALGDASRETDPLASAVVLPVLRGLTSEHGESFDALAGDRHV